MKKLLFILFLVLGMALDADAQSVDMQQSIALNGDSITIKQLLSQISERHNIRFSYSDSKLNTEQVVVVRNEVLTLEDFLDEFLIKNKIDYTIIDNQIVLVPANSKKTISGKLTNALDGSPIPYANIALSQTGLGTSTNELGEFELSVQNLPAELLISHLAYERKMVYIYAGQGEVRIKLMPAPKELAEITIRSHGSKNAYYRLLKKAYAKLTKSQSDFQFGKAFYRQKTRREDRFTEIFEMFYDIKYSAIGIEDWAVQEGRYAFQQTEGYDIFLYNKNFTLLSRLFPITQPKTDSYIFPVNPDVKKYFDLTLHSIINYENRYIAIVNYMPKKSVLIPAPSGQLYIDIDDYSIYKFTGKFTDGDLEIIGFNDDKSSWDNYELQFEITFIDDEAGQLKMDYVKIDHKFEYFFDQNFIGEMSTSSLLTFYEHYQPVHSKKLGGPIDFAKSDVETIDEIGYDPDFWYEHPIVKRTPLEMKLIRDFEENDAFGAVFMNNNEEVILLPGQQVSAAANRIIAQYEASNAAEEKQDIFLRLNRKHFMPGDPMHFTAYVFDPWTFKAHSLGSVMSLKLIDLKGLIVLEEQFDIDQGMVYGEVDLSDISEYGVYQVQVGTNVNKSAIYTTDIYIHPYTPSSEQDFRLANSDNYDGKVEIAPAGGVFLAGSEIKVVYRLPSGLMDRQTIWKITDSAGNEIIALDPDDNGIGSFMIIPRSNEQYYITNDHAEFALSPVAESGVSLNIGDQRSRSIPLNVIQKPAISRDIFILTTYKGKVLGFFGEKLLREVNQFDLPVQFLRDGINDIVITDIEGNMLAQRQVFNYPRQVNIELLSARWKSRRSQRIELKFRATDTDGKPLKANLNAVGFYREMDDCRNCDIRRELLLDERLGHFSIDLNVAEDSLRSTIENWLILKQQAEEYDYTIDNEYLYFQQDIRPNDELASVFAEVSISATGSSLQEQGSSRKVRSQRSESVIENFWIPKLNVDQNGVIMLELKLEDRNRAFDINIQGLTHDGSIVYSTLQITPEMIRSGKQ